MRFDPLVMCVGKVFMTSLDNCRTRGRNAESATAVIPTPFSTKVHSALRNPTKKALVPVFGCQMMPSRMQDATPPTVPKAKSALAMSLSRLCICTFHKARTERMAKAKSVTALRMLHATLISLYACCMGQTPVEMKEESMPHDKTVKKKQTRPNATEMVVIILMSTR